MNLTSKGLGRLWNGAQRPNQQNAVRLLSRRRKEKEEKENKGRLDRYNEMQRIENFENADE